MINGDGVASCILITLLVIAFMVFWKFPRFYDMIFRVILVVGNVAMAVIRFLFEFLAWAILFGTIALAAWTLVSRL